MIIYSICSIFASTKLGTKDIHSKSYYFKKCNDCFLHYKLASKILEPKHGFVMGQSNIGTVGKGV